jgi:hypothetical protein
MRLVSHSSISDTPHVWEVQIKRHEYVFCPVCGARRLRQKTFSQQIGFTNQNPDGTFKDARKVLNLLQKQADAWTPDPHCADHRPKEEP